MNLFKCKDCSMIILKTNGRRINLVGSNEHICHIQPPAYRLAGNLFLEDGETEPEPEKLDIKPKFQKARWTEGYVHPSTITLQKKKPLRTNTPKSLKTNHSRTKWPKR